MQIEIVRHKLGAMWFVIFGDKKDQLGQNGQNNENSTQRKIYVGYKQCFLIPMPFGIW